MIFSSVNASNKPLKSSKNRRDISDYRYGTYQNENAEEGNSDLIRKVFEAVFGVGAICFQLKKKLSFVRNFCKFVLPLKCPSKTEGHPTLQTFTST